MEQVLENDILAVFVVHFDITKGNVVEWQYPPDIDLEGIEYQAICSGLHKIESDVILFTRQKHQLGLCVFENKPTRDHANRGAYMKAIGVLVQPSDTVLHHTVFLKQEISKHMVPQEDIEPSRYDDLIQYYTQHQSQTQPTRLSTYDAPQDLNMNRSVNDNLRHTIIAPQRREYDGMDVFTDLIRQFGPHIFVLWKAALLRKRIMLLNTPPMEIACKYVHLIHLLGQVPPVFQKKVGQIEAKFAMGVNDIPQLEKQYQKKSYIACTPDSIFQMKTELYDILVKMPASCGTHRARIYNDELPVMSSRTVATEYNAADLIRYQIMFHQRAYRPSTGVWCTMSSLWTGLCYFVYDKQTTTTHSDWQRLFAGRRASRPIQLEEEEQQDLLAYPDEEQDATEIQNSQVFEAVAARASEELQRQEETNDVLLRSFHRLTGCMLYKLQSILSLRQEERIHTIHLYPKDMVQLGLDPQCDIDFVVELANLYFKKQVFVHGLHNSIGYVNDSLCCCKT
ncbi:uncharacterized protein B0P05DRAFT_530004 [Gilbertella persicaria]|uniref:uncharacterized protein n=1 Tax=Gilbertella persicaria TaxID=101096 RepID=UPI00222075E6|nr:uncharacterized protein B0P05DRAFT_530004 [Gilbertella persicaria]KAI8090248.1 hypothetical protein B0P05DRAFT_530004 [Gilbertella persicaria]